MPPLRRVTTLLCSATLLGCSGDGGTRLLAPDASASRLDASGFAAGPSVTGHANWINAGGDTVRRSFNAIQQKDGMVVGNFVQHNASGFYAKGEIDCLRFLGPTEAVLSGTIRKSTLPELVEERGIFRVGDGGEGRDNPAAVDRMSGLFVDFSETPVDCSTFANQNFTPIASGNIQVRP